MALPVGVGSLIRICVRGFNSLVADLKIVSRGGTIFFMASDDETGALVKLTLRNKYLVDILFGVANDFARLIEPNLIRCEHSKCKRPATVIHADLKVKMCDYHAAAGLVKARQSLTTNDANTLTDPLTVLRLRLASEECWVDLPNAVQIRRLQEYVQELSKNDEPDPPTDPAEHH